MTDTGTLPVVAKDPQWVPVQHYGSVNRLVRVAWLVSFEVLADGSRRNCCESTHGHKTKIAAKQCVIKTLTRLARQSTDQN